MTLDGVRGAGLDGGRGARLDGGRGLDQSGPVTSIPVPGDGGGGGAGSAGGAGGGGGCGAGITGVAGVDGISNGVGDGGSAGGDGGSVGGDGGAICSKSIVPSSDEAPSTIVESTTGECGEAGRKNVVNVVGV